MLLLGGPPRYSIDDAATRTGLDPEFIMAVRRANGVPALDPDGPAAERRGHGGGRDRARRARLRRLAGADPRHLARDGSRDASDRRADGRGAVRAVLPPGTRRVRARRAHDTPARPAAAADLRRRRSEPAASPARDRRQRGRQPARPPTRSPGTRQMAVAFADLVGFTRLGEELDVSRSSSGVANRLAVLVADVVDPPVRFVKTIGDAAMLVSPDPVAMLDALLRLIDAADAGRRGVPAAARRRHVRAGAHARRRLVRATGEPREPDHRAGAGGQRAGHARRARRGGRRPGRSGPRRAPARARRPRSRVALPRAAARQTRRIAALSGIGPLQPARRPEYVRLAGR